MADNQASNLPLSVQNFLNTLGVDTHIAYTDGGYANIQNVIDDLKTLGITHVRDGITNGENGSGALSSYIAMAQAGIKFTFIIEATDEATIQSRLTLINQVEAAVPGSVTSIEGPNEVNNQPITFGGISGLQGALNAQKALYADVHADAALAGVPVDYFTGYGAGDVGVGPDPSTTPGLADVDTAHPYPNFGQTPAAWVARASALPNAANPSTIPAIYTETGYSSNTVDEAVQAKYTLDLVLDTAKEGITLTFLYELMDAYAPGSYQSDAGWGSFDYTKAPKPLATAMHNLTTLLQDSGAQANTFTPAALNYAISGLDSIGNSLLMQKSDGTYVLAVWAEPQIWNNNVATETAAPTQNVTVTLPQSFAGIQVFDPIAGTGAIASYNNASSVTVAVSDHPVLIELGRTAVAVVTPPKDTLVLNLSEDAFAGDAQVMVSVDGNWVGNVETVTASKSAGKSQDVTLTGNFGVGVHKVTVNFLNDFYGGTQTTDRNLYVNSITLNGVTTVENASQLSQGAIDYTVTGGTTPVTTTPVTTTPVTAPVMTPVTTGSDTLVLNVSEDAFKGDAQFSVSVDGKQVGGTMTATALHGLGQSQDVTLQGNFGSGPHTVSVNFLNDLFDGISTDDRNLYVNSITLNGNKITPNTEFAYSGIQNFSITGGTAATPVSTPPVTTSPVITAPVTTIPVNTTPVAVTPVNNPVTTAGSDTLVLNVSEDAYKGDGQFTVSVDGKQVSGIMNATALHGSGQSQDVTLKGNFGAGSHTVSVDFLNDLWDGTSTTDRNLYVNSITLNGNKITPNAEFAYSGIQNFSITSGTAITTPLTPPVTTPPVIAITAQTLAKDTGVSATDNITINSAVTLYGTVTGTTGTTVKIFDGTTALGAATLDGKGGWTYTTTLASGTHALKAVATDTSGNTVSTAAQSAITVDTSAPAVAISTAAQTLTATGSTAALVLNGTVSDMSATSVQIMDGTTSLGAATLSNGTWTYNANLGIGSHTLTAVATDLAGNKTISAGDAIVVNAAPVVTPPATPPPATPTIVYSTGVDTSTTTRTTSVTTPVTIASTGADTLVLGIAEDAYLGDAQFTVSVDGQQIGGVQTATALHSAGQSQNFTLNDTLSAGNHTIAVDFMNDAAAIYSTGVLAGDRNLYVNSITLDGTTTVENAFQNLQGTVNYTVAKSATTTPVIPPVTPPVTTVTLPTVSISSQKLSADTGSSATDNVTSNGAVTLVGTVTGATGTSVKIYDGATVLGTATLDGKGGWTYSTTLASGAHALKAVATDTSGNTASTTAQAAITVDTTAPAVAITTAPQTLTATSTAATLALSGTVSDISATAVQIMDGTTALGNATVSNGTWTYNASLGVGSHALTAVATDLASNKTISASDAITVNAPATSTPPATGSTLVAPPSPTGTIGATPLVTFNWNPATQFKNFLAAEASVAAGTDGARAKIITIGDSTTAGYGGASVGYRNTTSYPAYLTQDLTLDGIQTQSDNFSGGSYGEDGRIALTGTANWANVFAAGGSTIGTQAVGDGFNFTLDKAGNYDRVDINYIDIGNGTLNLSLDGGLVFTSIKTGNTGQMMTQTITIPAGSHSELSVLSATATNMYLEGADFWNSTAPKTEIYNAGISGAGSDIVGTGATTGYGDIQGAVELKPNLALINFGINDIKNGGITPAQTVANIALMVADMRAINCDPVIIIPQPFWSSNYDSEMPVLRAGLQALSLSQNVPIIDLSATYGNDDGVALNNAGLTNDGIHPNATLYADISAQLAALLTTVVKSAGATSLVMATLPTVAISSQILTGDTGSSATDNVTSNGAVMLKGTVTGAAGTTVKILDSTSLLGTATLDGKGGWTYATTLTSGTHALKAVATDASGNTASTAAQSAITVDASAPTVAISMAAQTLTATDTAATLALNGTVDMSATSVQIMDGTSALGAATVSNGTWSYNANLGVGNHALTAIATDLAGNKTTSAGDIVTVNAPPVVTPPATIANTVLATVSTGSGTAQQTVNVSAATSGTYVPLSMSGIGENSLVTYNWNPSTQLTNFLAAEAAAKAGMSGTPAKIVAIGDSTTRGFGASALGWSALSYVSEMTQALNQNGIAAQSDNFLGGGVSPSNGLVEDNRIKLVNGATTPFIIDAGGVVIGTNAAGQGTDFTLDSPAKYDHVTISYIDVGGGSVTVGVDGGAVLNTLKFGNTGKTLTQTIAIPAGLHSQLNIRAVDGNATYIQGAAFYNSASAAIMVSNAGIDGWDSGSANTSTYYGSSVTGSAHGFGQTAGAVATQPNLTLIDLGINDIIHATETTAQTVANITQIVATVRASGSDTVIVIPQPFSDPAYATQLPALRTALQALSTAQNVPIIDLSATYNNDPAALAAAGLMSDNVHPNATLYADIGSQIAGLLTKTINNTSNVTTVNGTSGNNTLSGTAATNVLTGNGGNDTYVMNTGDQKDTIFNGATGAAASGQLNVLAANHNQLWFKQSGNDLLVDVLGTTKQAVVKNWYSGTASKQLQKIAANDGLSIDSNIQLLVQAMASFSTANSGFDPTSATHTSLTDSYFNSALATEVGKDWHK